ncbi:hypothetical protein [Aeromonas rivipollensis]|uniref:hypothetical protein n=1 Tax=Aeromonas rivipollensis TaxID=948519 RepID=UPI0038D1C145
MIRAICYVFFFYLCVFGMQSVSNLNIEYMFFNANTLPFFFCFCVTSWLIEKNKYIKINKRFELTWVDGLCKLSIAISIFIILATLTKQGRDAKLESISENIVLYYLSFINTAIIMIVLSSMFQPYNKIYGIKTTNLIMLTVVFAVFMSYSRSLAFFLLISCVLSGARLDITLRRLSIFILPVLLVVLMMPILQGRTEDYGFAMLRTIQNVYFYNAFPFYLGEELINSSAHYQGISFGYIGFLLSNILGVPLDSNYFFNEKILYEFIQLGTSLTYGDINANVMYPVWATTAVDFGNLSILFYVTVSIIILTLYYLNLTIMASWIFFRFYVLGFMVSPFLLRDTMFELSVALIVQFFIYGKNFIIKVGPK